MKGEFFEIKKIEEIEAGITTFSSPMDCLQLLLLFAVLHDAARGNLLRSLVATGEVKILN